jgi:hypothetical protein
LTAWRRSCSVAATVVERLNSGERWRVRARERRAAARDEEEERRKKLMNG